MSEAEEMRLVTTRGVGDARLPANYEAMTQAIAECERVDECAEWASKAAALASYAKQANDEESEHKFRRVRVRAIRRCGELLKEIPSKAHGREVGGRPPTSQRSERAQAAVDAGLSPDQTKDALRIAKIPERDFEDAVESDSPPTVEALAERGTQKKPEPLVDLQGIEPRDFNASLHLAAALARLVDQTAALPPEDFARGVLPSDRKKIATQANMLARWLTDIRLKLEKRR